MGAAVSRSSPSSCKGSKKVIAPSIFAKSSQNPKRRMDAVQVDSLEKDEVSVHRNGRVSTICHKLDAVSLDDVEDDQDEEEEECPICLEVYSEENPQISTNCKHHYHLSCILEWTQRSCTCPVCNQVMLLDGQSDLSDSAQGHLSA